MWGGLGLVKSKWRPVRCEEEWILALRGILEYSGRSKDESVVQIHSPLMCLVFVIIGRRSVERWIGFWLAVMVVSILGFE